MNSRDLRMRLADGALSRRQLNRLLAAAGLTAVTVPVVARRARAEDQVIYFTWSGYDDPGFFPGYVKKHSANPNMPIFADEEEGMQKLRAGFTVDVAHPCNSSVARWYDAGIIQPIDTARLSHWGDLFPALTGIENAQHDGKQFFVPIDWGNTSIIYRSDLVDIKEESWTLLWDERYKGKLSVAAGAEETVAIAAIVAGAKNPFSMTDQELAKVKDLLLKQKPLLRFYWDTNTTVEGALASGELVAATGWNSSVITLRGQGINVKFMQPKEGILTWCCGLVIAKGAPHPDLAYDLLDAMTAPEAGKWLVEKQGYGHSNRKTFDLVDDKALAERGLPKDPTQLLSAGILFQKNARMDEINGMFEAVKAGL
jgi:spermidine/putrescine transport system substrate-binding protein